MTLLRKYSTISLLLLVIGASAGADALTDLRGSLGRLRGTEPVRASYDLQLEQKAADSKDREVGRASATVEAGPDGVAIRYAPQIIDQARAESLAAVQDPEKNTGTRSAINEISAFDVAEKLNYAPALLRELATATLIENKASTWQGRPARLLVFRSTPKLSKEQKKHVKKAEVTLQLWLGDDGLPIGGRRSGKFRASFLLISFENERSASWNFLRRGDRLVVTRAEESDVAGGLGKKFIRKTVTVVKPL